MSAPFSFLEAQISNLRHNKVGEDILDRVRRLNPPTWDGKTVLRGFYRKTRLDHMKPVLGKRQFIERFGRHAWRFLPPWLIWRDGRRLYVDRYGVEQSIWELYDGTRSDTVFVFYDDAGLKRIIPETDFPAWRAKNVPKKGWRT